MVEVRVIIIGLPCFLRLPWRSSEIEQQDAEWMSVTLSMSATVWSSGIYEGTKVQWLPYPSISAMMMLLRGFLHSFLNPPTASHSIQLPCLVVIYSALPGSCFPADSQKNIGVEGCLRGTRVRGNWPWGSTICRGSLSSSICVRVRSSVNLRTDAKPRAAACCVTRIWQRGRAFERRSLLQLDTN